MNDGNDNDNDDPLLDNHQIIVVSDESNSHQSIDSLQEWFFWSYLNVLIGGVILGVIAIGCSLRTHKFKRRQNYSKANKWSYVTFIINLLSTLIGLSLCGYLIFEIARPKHQLQTVLEKH